MTEPTDAAPLNVIDLMRVVMDADNETRGVALRGTTNWAAHIGKAVQNAVLAKWGTPPAVAGEPCPTCIALARTVMLDQVSFDRKPDCYGIRQITDDEGLEEWEDIRTGPDVAREEANDMMATGRGEIYEVVPLWTTPQPSPTPQADSQPAPNKEGFWAWWEPYQLPDGWIARVDLVAWHAWQAATIAARAPADRQPAPVEAADAMADSQYLAGVSAGWNAANADDPNDALRKLHESRAGYLKPLRAARAPADRQPAPVRVSKDRLPNWSVESHMDAIPDPVASVTTSDARVVTPCRAALAPADSVTAPAAYSGNLEQELAMLIRRIVSSARRNCEDGSNVLKLANEAWAYLVRKGLNGSPLRDAGIETAPTPPAQAADSVLEDAARLLRQILAASQDGDSDTHLSAHFVSRIETITNPGGAA